MTAANNTVTIASIMTLIVPRGDRKGREGNQVATASRAWGREGTTLRFTLGGEDFKLFSGAHQRASRQERAVPRRGASVVGCQSWLIWRLYVYYDTPGRNTSSSLLANRSERGRHTVESRSLESVREKTCLTENKKGSKRERKRERQRRETSFFFLYLSRVLDTVVYTLSHYAYVPVKSRVSDHVNVT